MNRKYIREQKTVCGKEYMEIDLFPVTEAEHKASRRAKKEKASRIAMQNCNERYSRRYLNQLVATNFSREEGAMVLHLTYEDGYLPDTWEGAGRDLSNFVRKLNRRCKKKGLPKAKWIGVTEHQDANPAENVKEVRFHHHMILQCGLSLDEIKDSWSTGRGLWQEPLGLITADRAEFKNGTLDAFCQYITKYPRRKRRWRQSQGLKSLNDRCRTIPSTAHGSWTSWHGRESTTASSGKAGTESKSDGTVCGNTVLWKQRPGTTRWPGPGMWWRSSGQTPGCKNDRKRGRVHVGEA